MNLKMIMSTKLYTVMCTIYVDCVRVQYYMYSGLTQAKAHHFTKLWDSLLPHQLMPHHVIV